MTSLGIDGGTPFRMLVVCTGNICRSPLIEQLLRARMTAAGIPAVLLSAGTQAVLRGAMTPEATALSLHYGGVPVEHRPRQLTAQLVAQADLVFTATREHRSEVVSLHPRAARYAFTLKQFSRLAGTFDPSPLQDPAGAASALRAYVEEVSARRGLSPPPADLSDDDIEDPYLQSQDCYDRVGCEIDEAVTTIITGFAKSLGRTR